jgi:hypothetical protein
MELSEILSEIGEEKAAVVNAAIEAEKNRGIEAARKKGQDVNKFMSETNKHKDRFRAIGLDPDGDLDAQLVTIKERLEKATNSKGEDDPAVKKLERQLAAIVAKLEATEKEKAEATQKYTKTRLSESLRKAFGDQINGVGLAVDNLIYGGKVKLSENDEVVFVNGSDELTIEEGVAAFKKQYPELVKNTQNPGGGSAPQGKPNSKSITISQYEAMSVKDRATFFAGGGEIR